MTKLQIFKKVKNVSNFLKTNRKDKDIKERVKDEIKNRVVIIVSASMVAGMVLPSNDKVLVLCGFVLLALAFMHSYAMLRDIEKLESIAKQSSEV